MKGNNIGVTIGDLIGNVNKLIGNVGENRKGPLEEYMTHGSRNISKTFYAGVFLCWRARRLQPFRQRLPKFED
jgi:hypothetical protein